ncbi:MAG TPA: putative porin [Myxococcota bacterium]|jgi:hypothetical protein|nr:putative porin [Myxococcota bacterium]
MQLRLVLVRTLGVLLLAATALATRARAEDASPPEPSPAAAEMLKSMREKGVLSEEEYQDLYRRQARYEADQRAADSVPGWLKDWTFGGDLRFRWDRQYWGPDLRPGPEFVPGDDNVNVSRPDGGRGTGNGTRQRFRLRLRLGAEKLLSEDFQFGFRIATSQGTSVGGETYEGSSTPWARAFQSDWRSTNVTLGDYFSPKGIYLDRAYLRYTPTFAETLRIVAGKFANPFINGANPAEGLMWDPDINPEGVAAQYRFDIMPGQFWFDGAAGYFILDEVPSVTLDVPQRTVVTVSPNYDERDPSMWGVQGGLTAEPLEWLRANMRLAYYDLRQLNTGFAATVNDLGNGGDAIDRDPLFVLLNDPQSPLYQSGRTRGQMQELVVDGYLRFTPWGERWAIKPFAEFSTILTAHSEDKAYGIGVELGSLELARLTVLYGNVERNGTVALFTDSDLLDGFTNVKGWNIGLERSLTSFMRARVNYSKTKVGQRDCLLADKDGGALCDTFFGFSPSALSDYRKTQRDRIRWQIDLLVDF